MMGCDTRRNCAKITEPEKKDELPETKEKVPVKRNFAMLSRAGRAIGGVSRKKEEYVLADKTAEANIPFVTQRMLKGTDPNFSGFRHFPVIEMEGEEIMKPVRAKVHVSKKSFTRDVFMKTTRLAVRNKEIEIHVQGLAADFDSFYDAKSLNDP